MKKEEQRLPNIEKHYRRHTNKPNGEIEFVSLQFDSEEEMLQWLEHYHQQKLAEVMPKGKKPDNRKELSLWNYWDSNTSEEREDVVERAFKMIEAQKKYIELLGEELDELAGLAYAHGWRSKRSKQGEQMRKEIKQLTQEK